MKFYAGIGSRETPPEILAVMREVAAALADAGWALRSGAAPGADSAFEAGADKKAIYLPWPGFEGRNSAARERPQDEAYAIAERFHPAWDRLSRGARALHARNAHQVLGWDVTKPEPSRFVICWTKGAQGGGGTGQALRIARTYNVPVFDLADPAALARVQAFIDQDKEA